MRMIGDPVFAIAVALFVLFMVGLITGWSCERRPTPALKPLHVE